MAIRIPKADGAPSDSSYPALLEQLFAETGAVVHIQNFGVCANDPRILLHPIAGFGHFVASRYNCSNVRNWRFDGPMSYRVVGLSDLIPRGGRDAKNPGSNGFTLPLMLCARCALGCLGLHYNYLLRTQAEYENAMQELEPLWNGIFAGHCCGSATAQHQNSFGETTRSRRN
jgi:hypothetical protein